MYRPATATSILLGVLSIIIGIVALAWPGVTILAIVLLCAVGSVLGHLVLALIDLAAGAFAVAWPAPTALVLVLLLGIWAVTGGVFEFFAAFQAGQRAGTRAIFIIGGLVTVLFGLVVLARPGIGALTLALLFGLFNLIYGVWQIAFGAELHNTAN
jgi:uncharacterized membrane protein HdeD (DUF308 family)